jgi:hypothetical protein
MHLVTFNSTSTFATLCRAVKNAVPRGHEGAVPAAAGAGGGEPGATLQQRRRRPGTEGSRQLPQEVGCVLSGAQFSVGCFLHYYLYFLFNES